VDILPKAKKMKRKNSFTLIELLVVVAIIAVLISILVPSLKAARSQARAVLCMSDMKQVGLALQFYAEDFKGWIPCARNDSISSLPWFRVIGKENHPDPRIGLGYIPYYMGYYPGGNSKIYCRGMVEKFGSNHKGNTWGLSTSQGDPTRLRKLNAHSFPQPAGKVLLADCDLYPPDPVWFYGYVVGRADFKWYTSGTPHNQASNVLFADQHLERVDEDMTTNSHLDLPDEAFESIGWQGSW